MMNFLSFLDSLWESRTSNVRNRKKQSLRAVLTQKRRILSHDVVKACSANVIEKLVVLPEFQQATRIMIYYPVQNEIDLRSLYDLYPDKHFYMPVTHRRWLEVREYNGKENVKRGRFGIPEPIGETYKGSLDLILVPAVAFDKQNNRLGRGGGYYDKFLKRFRRATKIGVGYWFQLLETLPVSHWDMKMSQVVVSSKFSKIQAN